MEKNVLQEKIAAVQRKDGALILKKNFKHCCFGEYPQTKVTDEATIAALNSLAGELPDENNGKSWTSYGYYCSCEKSDYTWYKDLEYNNERFRGVYFTAYRPEFCAFGCTAKNSSQDENGYTAFNAYWFKYEPIKWKILGEREGKRLIFSDIALDGRHYDFKRDEDAYDYENSDIRIWLNGDFYNTAFSSRQKRLILVANVDNRETFEGREIYCKITKDKVFLLSDTEATIKSFGFAEKYGVYDGARQKRCSDYAQCQGCMIGTESHYKGNCGWWLRSINRRGKGAHIAGFYGRIAVCSALSCTNLGVVPALILASE